MTLKILKEHMLTVNLQAIHIIHKWHLVNNNSLCNIKKKELNMNKSLLNHDI